MAFSEAQRARVRYYLGWPEVFFRSVDAVGEALDIVGGRPAAQAIVEELLAKLDALDEEIDTDVVRSSKAVQVGSVKLRGPYQLDAKNARGRELVQRLANILGVEPMGGVFGAERTTDNCIAQG